MALVICKLLHDALPIAHCGRVTLEEPRVEVVIERNHPPGAVHLRVRDYLHISLGQNHRLVRRSIADPDIRAGSGPHETQESGVRVDPRRSAGSRFSGTALVDLDAGPDALPRAYYGSLAVQ